MGGIKYFKQQKPLYLHLCVEQRKVHTRKSRIIRLIKFLIGMNELYTAVRRSILMMTHLSSMAQVFSILIQKEKQRELWPNNMMNMDSTTLNASFPGMRNFRIAYCFNHSPSYLSNGNTENFSKDNYVDKSKLFCDYYKRIRHTRKNCYKLISCTKPPIRSP